VTRHAPFGQIFGVVSGLSLETLLSNVKSVALTVFELLALNSHDRPLRTHRQTHIERTSLGGVNYNSSMSVINNELTCLALTGCVGLNARRRSASCVVEGVQSDATQLNSTRRLVKLSCVAINGATLYRGLCLNMAFKRISQLLFNYDTTATRLQRKIDMFAFARVEWK